MELYEEFAGRLRSRLQEVSHAPTPGDLTPRRSSCILFHGLGVLPPVLTEQRRKEILRYKEETLRLPRLRKTAECNPRMLRVQMLLDSVQVRRAPTLKEFVQSKDTAFMMQSADCLDASTEFSSRTDRTDGASVPLRDLPLPVSSTMKSVYNGKVDDIMSLTLACGARSLLGTKRLSWSSGVDKQSRTQDSVVSLETADTGQEHLEQVISKWKPPPDSICVNVLKTEHARPRLGSARNTFWSFPRPQLSCSPIRCEKGGGSARKVLVNADLTLRNNAGRVGCLAMGEERLIEKILDRSVQIGRLETCLSSLKSSISDLGAILVWQDEPTEEQCPRDKQLACACRVPLPRLVLAERRCNGPGCCMTNTSRVSPGDIGYWRAAEDCCPSSNQSYDMETPSRLWLQAEPDQGAGRGTDQWGEVGLGIPEPVNYILGSRVKRRLLVEPSAESMRTVPDSRAEGKQSCSASKVCGAIPERRLTHKAAPWAQVVEQGQTHMETRRMQDVEEQLQLQVHQTEKTPCPLVLRCRPLVAAAVKGFLTRRLLHTERVVQLRRIVKDSQDFLLVFQLETHTGGALVSQQDLVLLERVLLQLRSALYEIHDIFFYCTIGERMNMISRDRELARARELKRLEKEERQSHRVPGTAKPLERKRSWTVQKMHEVEQREAKGRDGQRRVCEHVCQKSTPVLCGRL